MRESTRRGTLTVALRWLYAQQKYFVCSFYRVQDWFWGTAPFVVFDQINFLWHSRSTCNKHSTVSRVYATDRQAFFKDALDPSVTQLFLKNLYLLILPDLFASNHTRTSHKPLIYYQTATYTLDFRDGRIYVLYVMKFCYVVSRAGLSWCEALG